MWDKAAVTVKVQYLHRSHRRICSGYKRKGGCALPGEIYRPASVLPPTRVVGMGG